MRKATEIRLGHAESSDFAFGLPAIIARSEPTAIALPIKCHRRHAEGTTHMDQAIFIT
jgi:hypothetical protein